jgi:hypothetical protein
MIKLDLRQKKLTLEELLHFASLDSVLILANDGKEFILEAADEFEREVALLGQSEKFMEFLAERSKEKGVISIEEIERKLDETDD